MKCQAVCLEQGFGIYPFPHDCLSFVLKLCALARVLTKPESEAGHEEDFSRVLAYRGIGTVFRFHSELTE